MRARAAKMTRIRKACDICRMRKVKCDGVSPCKPCQALGAQCTFQYVSRHRGPVSRFAGAASTPGVITLTLGAAASTPGAEAATPATPVMPDAAVTHRAASTASTDRDPDRKSPQQNLPGSPGFMPVYTPTPMPTPMPMPTPQPPLPGALSLPPLQGLDLSADHAMDVHGPQRYGGYSGGYSGGYYDGNGRPPPPQLPQLPSLSQLPPLLPQPQPQPQPHLPLPLPPPPPPPSPPSPPSATDSIAPFPILKLLVDDFFTYIHPLIPFPHEPTFRRRFADPAERQTPRFLALVASMMGCLAASFPRSVRAHLRARKDAAGGGKFARAIYMVECCRSVALTARGATFYVQPALTVDDAATSYFLALAAGYTFDWRLCRRFMAEAMCFVQELGFHRAAPTVPPVVVNHVDDQIGRRIFWILYLAMRSMLQLGTALSDTLLPPFNSARPFPDLPAEVDDAYIEPGAIGVQPPGTVSLITGFNKTIQIYATMDPIASLEYARGLSPAVPVAAQRTLFVEALQAAKAITETLPDELYLPLPGSLSAEQTVAQTQEATQEATQQATQEATQQATQETTPTGQATSPGTDTSTPVEGFYDELSGYRYYPPADDAASSSAGLPGSPLQLRRSASVSPPRNAPFTSSSRRTTARRPDDLRLLLKTDPARRRQVQYDIQKTNIYASQLATRSYYVEMYLQLGDDTESSPMKGERERIVHSLLFVLATIPQPNMEPNGSALINKIRQVASTILGAAGSSGGTAASPMEAQLMRFLDILMRLEKTGGPGRPTATTSAASVSSEEDVDEEEELQNWASLREEQMRFAASGGFLFN